MNDSDRHFMELAVAEARKSLSENDRPNPRVAAVAARGAELLGTAYRGEIAPGQHAEYTLLEKKLGAVSLANATIYTTLEPCTRRNHPKQPCAQWLIQRKVARVVIGMLDPNPVIRGKGLLMLRNANIATELFDADLMAQLEELNREFIQSVQSGFVHQATNEIIDIATQSGTNLQQNAMGQVIQKCLDDLRHIKAGQIPIGGGDAGYFKYILDLIHGHTVAEHVKAFIKVTPLEAPGGFEKFSMAGLYQGLHEAVRSGKLTVEYVFLLRREKSLNDRRVKSYLARYKKFSSEIRLVYEEKTRLDPSALQYSIALLTARGTAFTHNRDNDGHILSPVQWITDEDYRRLHEQYMRIRMDSNEYFVGNRGGLLTGQSSRPSKPGG